MLPEGDRISSLALPVGGIRERDAGAYPEAVATSLQSSPLSTQSSKSALLIGVSLNPEPESC